MADMSGSRNNKDMLYPTGMTGEVVVDQYLSKTAFSSPTKLDKLANADAKGMYENASAVKGK